MITFKCLFSKINIKRNDISSNICAFNKINIIIFLLDFLLNTNQYTNESNMFINNIFMICIQTLNKNLRIICKAIAK